jgi:autophagy-related protein 11
MNVTPPIRPSQLAASYLRTTRLHHEQINQLLVSLRYQHEAIRIATSSLDLHVLAIFDTFDSIAVNAKRELAKQTSLLEGLNSDLEMIKRVRIHADFMSAAVRRAIEAGERHRTLGDYVSNDKMRTVAAGCARTHGVCACVNPQCSVDVRTFRGLGITFRTHGKGCSQVERRHRYRALLCRW